MTPADETTAPGGDSKRFETARALAALQAFELHRNTEGGYLLCSWNLSRLFSNLDFVEAFLARIGGRHG